MPDDLYERDILTWSEHQADLLRRVARDELVEGIDWDNVIDEIESVGLSFLHDTWSNLRRMLVALLKVHGWFGHRDLEHWRDDATSCQAEAEQRFTPSMRGRIDLADLYGGALEQVGLLNYDGQPPLPLPETCPFTLDQLLNERRPALEAILANAQPAGRRRRPNRSRSPAGSGRSSRYRSSEQRCPIQFGCDE